MLRVLRCLGACLHSSPANSPHDDTPTAEQNVRLGERPGAVNPRDERRVAVEERPYHPPLQPVSLLHVPCRELLRQPAVLCAVPTHRYIDTCTQNSV